MEILNKVKTWAGALAEVGISIAALMIVIEVLGLSSTVMPFLPTASVISNVSGIVATLGSQGLVGLVAVWVLYEIWNRK
jgi:predicted cation transporter|tara:strand:- start:189 stop:425 length:237 start_codon:yes stop_codon:yes gene_type:complete